jgi:hypothetical protein
MLATRGPTVSAGWAGSCITWLTTTHVASRPRFSAKLLLAVAAVLSVVDTSTEMSRKPFAGICVAEVSARSMMPVRRRGPTHGSSSAS